MDAASRLASLLLWPALTVALYLCVRVLNRRLPRWWTSPLLLTPLLLLVPALALHTDYGDYSRGAHWLVLMLGPVTVAFALPIWEQRELIRRHWPVLAAGVVMGSALAMLTAWGLAALLGLPEDMRLSLLPRSVSTPFAMSVSGDIGGVPNLTAVFVVLTGIFGALAGDIVLRVLPLRSVLARGALLGMGAHGAGVARAGQLGREEGSVASLVMILAGLCNVLAAPFIALCLN